MPCNLKARAKLRVPRPIDLLSRAQVRAFRAHRRASYRGFDPSRRQRAAWNAYWRAWRALSRARWLI